ncbi:unnamed protein product [Dibothriocephalus latus]|uniref:Glycine cleavage system H protein, mitochondrial n=1 Tax=Dibothriocephalus latus TaxID=60516 RepID=A0A3P7P5S4_DIBLA|nr:unnamed protein product [Dibothriocephalus latus]
MGTVGMSKYAVDKLGDIVFIQLPDVGTNVTQDGECGTIESVKAASDFYAPVSGVVKTINEAIENKPSVLNKSPEDQGMCSIYFSQYISTMSSYINHLPCKFT